MKKLIFLLCTITFTVISFLSIKQFEYLEFQSFNYDMNHSHENWDVEIKSGNPSKSKFENFQMLTEIVKKSKVNLQRMSQEIGADKKEKLVYYVALSNVDTYFQNMNLKTGNLLDENSNPNLFLSTISSKDKNQIGQLEIFHNFDPIEIRPMVAAEKVRDIKGIYSLSNTKDVKIFEKIAADYGFVLKIAPKDSPTSASEYPYQSMIYTTCFVLCLLLLLSITYDVMNNYKAIAIQFMHGDSFFNIGMYLLKRYGKIIVSSWTLVLMGLIVYLYPYNGYQKLVPFLNFWMKKMMFLFLIIGLILIITWIGTKAINISQMIKNKKPIKLFFYTNLVVRFILAIFLILGLQQGISTFIELKKTSDQQNKWKILKNYSFLGIEAGTENTIDSKDKDSLTRFKKLYEELEEQGAIYISPSYYYANKKTLGLDANPWGSEGKQIVINTNYLSLNPIYDIHNKKLKLPTSNKYEITVLVPEKYKAQEEAIKETTKQDYAMMLNKENPDAVQVNINYVKNNQSYFTFTSQMAVQTNYEIEDPIAVILTSNFEENYLASTIAMGYGYYTKNSTSDKPFDKTKQTIRKYEFDSIWSPVSVAYSDVEMKIQKDTEKLQLTIINCGLFLVLTAVLLFFSAIYYLEINKQTLALQWIFGYSFFEKHNLVYLALLVFWQLSFTTCFFISKNSWLLFKISLILAICDMALMSILLILNEYKITKQILMEK